MKAAFLIAALCAVAVATGVQNRDQQANQGPISLVHTGGLLNNVPATQVNVRCVGDTAELRLVRTAERTGRGRIRIGSVPDATGCSSLPADIPAYDTENPLATPITLLATSTCERSQTVTDTVTSYKWSVFVSEWYQSTGVTSQEYVFDFTFSVTCSTGPNPIEQVAEVDAAPALSEGDAAYTGQVDFTLTTIRDPAVPPEQTPNPRVWVLQLVPNNIPSLRGLSYEIKDLIASAGEAADAPKALLIENGCVKDVDGVDVDQGTAADQRTIIRIAAFRFKEQPTAEVNFAATVRLCTPETPNGICLPVKPAGECTTGNGGDGGNTGGNTGENTGGNTGGNTGDSSRQGVSTGRNENLPAVRAPHSRRMSRSVRTSPLGQLRVSVV